MSVAAHMLGQINSCPRIRRHCDRPQGVLFFAFCQALQVYKGPVKFGYFVARIWSLSRKGIWLFRGYLKISTCHSTYAVGMVIYYWYSPEGTCMFAIESQFDISLAIWTLSTRATSMITVWPSIHVHSWTRFTPCWWASIWATKKTLLLSTILVG